MEKYTPHCKLSRVKALVGTGNVRLTTSTVFGARRLGFTETEAIGVVMSLDTVDFYKSMTTYADHTIWQDVYRRCTVNDDVYLKLTVIDDVLIVSFKER
ncbi:type II toxin-antitoxin system MqsR family toxin [Burkholderia sp. BCC1988]|uniref:type II toxin-antitoxin system MqsR family toxin n=1 Tax=Burkholderia sp. BCC1988 TaxID=2817443 RepID=UPI002AAF32C6|nr:type II toxin-antitoxin system MqsR family toxin [Burkholderia sp. BCC1988]